MNEREPQYEHLGIRLTISEKQQLRSIQRAAGLPTLSSALRLLINQADGILPPRVVGKYSANANRGAQVSEAQRAAAAR